MKEGWEYKNLGEVADFFRGLTYGKQDETRISNVCVLRSNNIDLESMSLNFDELKYLRSDFSIPSEKKLKANSIFICMSNGSKQHVGKVAFVSKDYDYAFGGFMGLIKPKNTMNAKYTYYACRSSLFKHFLLGVGNGIGITNLRFADLFKFNFPVPPISEQQRIVEELDLLSSIIEKKKEQLKELDNLAQSIFYDMFGDPVLNDMEWEVKALKELVYIGLGFTHTPQYIEKGVPFVSVKDISSGYLDFSNIKYVSKEEYDSAPKGAKPQKGDLMFCRVGTMGKPLIVKTDMQFCTFVSVGYMRRLQNNIDMSFLKYWMMSYGFDKQVQANVRGLAIKNLNTGWLKNFTIYLPPLTLQQQFASKIEAIEHQKELIKQSIKEVETLFNSRMDYYFN